MKTITICGKEYPIECNALTYVKYQTFFKTGILKDMQFIQNYLIKQTIVVEQVKKEKLNDAERLNKVSEYMIDDTDEFITKVTQIAWILIYTADKKIENYDDWLSNITKISIDDDWISEVTEIAVNCFLR